MSIWFAVKRLWLGIGLIALTSAVLLLSDWGRRAGAVSAPAGAPKKVAVLQYSSTPVMEDGARGMLDALGERGIRDGGRIALTWFKAEADMAIANAIAKQMTAGEYDLVVTLGTPALQAVANANRAGRVTHVFGVVAAPRTAGVGIGDKGPLDHPRHLIGVGTYIRAGESFTLARRLYPGLKSVGIVWNAAESNSRVFTTAAKEACRELGIDVLEANVENSAGVGESAASLVARGADALWLGGDNTVMTAAGSLMAAGQRGRIPVFTMTPGNADRGALFDYGANLYENGREMGRLIAEVLDGADPARLPVEDVVVPQIAVNTVVVKDLKDPWRIPDDVLRSADLVIDDTGVHAKTRAAEMTGRPASGAAGAAPAVPRAGAKGR